MSNSFTAQARSFDPSSQINLNALVEGVYWETFTTLGEVPIVVVLPKEIISSVTHWHIRCLLPGKPPKLVPSEGTKEIGILVPSGAEVYFPICALQDRIVCDGPVPGTADEIMILDDEES